MNSLLHYLIYGRIRIDDLCSDMKDWDFTHLKCYFCKQVQILIENEIGHLQFYDL